MNLTLAQAGQRLRASEDALTGYIFRESPMDLAKSRRHAKWLIALHLDAVKKREAIPTATRPAAAPAACARAPSMRPRSSQSLRRS